MAGTQRGSNISFGTDGWRSYIAGDFTFDNVALVGTAIVRYLDEEGLGSKPLLVGYDRRFGAELFGAHISTAMHAAGQPVLLFDAALPTPAVAYAVSHLGAAGAVMLTASHNPHTFQGLKFIPYYAGNYRPHHGNHTGAGSAVHAAATRTPVVRRDYLHSQRVFCRAEQAGRP
ncbi:MAG: hypothetical protein M3R04_04265 [bacterium]|nr:hypothetical protein [bacterium]